jgi:hypothetical protein
MRRDTPRPPERRDRPAADRLTARQNRRAPRRKRRPAPAVTGGAAIIKKHAAGLLVGHLRKFANKKVRMELRSLFVERCSVDAERCRAERGVRLVVAVQDGDAEAVDAPTADVDASGYAAAERVAAHGRLGKGP